ncbi:MAG: hypothetical protein WD490_07800 [Opitutales bacterium]
MNLSIRLCYVFALLSARFASAEIFQYRTAAAGSEKGDVFLWVPPEAPQVRGILAAGFTLMEPHLVVDPQIREVCRSEGLGILFSTVGLKAFDLQKTLDALAAQSGLPEIATAPLFFAGHSAGGPQAMERAREFGDRCFGLMQFRGGLPYGVAPEIPSLVMMGQFDEYGGVMRFKDGREHAWERPRDELAKLRKAAPGSLYSIAVEPGAGHFAWSERNAELFSLFLRKSTRQLDPDGSLTRVDPATGWVTSLKLREPFEPMPAVDYTGNADEVSWHFDREMAEAHIAFHADLPLRKKDQFLRWENPYWVDAGVRYFFNDMDIVGDGQTFRIHPVYADKVPGQPNGQGPEWLEAGQPVGNSGAPIHAVAVGGPLKVTGANEIRLEYSILHPVTTPLSRITFMAQSPGNDAFRATEIVGMVPRGWKGPGRGPGQTITFPELEDVSRTAKSIDLKATSTSGLPVEYHILYGPALIRDGKLIIADLPARGRFPIEVSVAAYQVGSGVEPFFSAAAPVIRTFNLK